MLHTVNITTYGEHNLLESNYFPNDLKFIPLKIKKSSGTIFQLLSSIIFNTLYNWRQIVFENEVKYTMVSYIASKSQMAIRNLAAKNDSFHCSFNINSELYANETSECLNIMFCCSVVLLFLHPITVVILPH